jgi:hypothetical protein
MQKLRFANSGFVALAKRKSMVWYPYATVEAALADLYRAKTETQRRTLRARINHLQRLAVIDVAPGKGKALQYQQDHIWRWMFCFEMAEFGVSPAVSAALVESYWKQVLGGIFRSAQRAIDAKKEDVFFYIRGSALMSAAWNPESNRFAAVPHIGKFTAGNAGLVLNWLQYEEVGVAPRLCIVNLSARLRVLRKSMGAMQELTRLE